MAQKGAQHRPSVLAQWPPKLSALHADWQLTVNAFWSKPEGQGLLQRMQEALRNRTQIYPAEPMAALASVAPHAVQVVILGQDPYHGPGQAHGLAFSVPPGVPVPPSLRNVLAEVRACMGLTTAQSGCLGGWAKQGVLLLNTCLTVESGKPAQHADWGWEVLTDMLIAQVAQQPQAVVFMLWGKHAQRKAVIIQDAALHDKHLVLQCNHPSPLAATRKPLPFMGCRHFLLANVHLKQHGQEVVYW